MKRTLLPFFAVLATACASSRQYPGAESQFSPFAPDGVEFRIADTPWTADMHGNHRAVVLVSQAAKAAEVTLQWRRPDLRPESKKVVVTDPQGREVRNVKVEQLSAQQGRVVFEPVAGVGTYHVYYLPYRFRKGWDDARYSIWNDYLPATYACDSAWSPDAGRVKAQVVGYESRTRFDYLTPMGLIATREEEDSVRKVHPSGPVVFMEDRAFPIRLKDHLPAKWMRQAAHSRFEGGAAPNEYYTWQIGVWAAHGRVEDVRLTFSDFRNGDAVIGSEQVTCFNQEGVNWDGKPLRFDVHVEKDKLQSLWCGVQIPENARKGVYRGTATLHAKGLPPQELSVSIEVSGDVLADKGDGDLWRHARLRWLNSQIGVDSLPVVPYAAMQLQDHTIQASGKQLSLQPNGMIGNVLVDGRELYASPLRFVVVTDQGEVPFSAQNLSVSKKADGLVEWTSSSLQQGIAFSCSAYMEYDGYIRYHIDLSADRQVEVKDIRMESRYAPYASKYFMGIEHAGGLRPEQHSWAWSGPYDSYWMGNELAGAHVEFRGGSYHGPLLNDYKPAPPASWSNQGKGKVVVTGRSGEAASVVASTGACMLDNSPLRFEFSILPTPVKKLDSGKHFSERYFHAESRGFDAAAQEGANIANIHHSYVLNPVINYPFIVRDSLVQFVKEQHRHDRKVKLYYTIRELTNYTTEIHALKSLGNEILLDGPGYGTPWHMEHLVDGYKAAWYTELPGEHADAALVLSGFSRWINYYLEGLRWMFEHYEIDGIYMDDVSFDRNVMKRMRKIMEQYRPGALIDLHSNTWYSVGPMNQYADYFPYINRLWFGESFQYNKMDPDQWFVTFSGIPFGMMGEMLQDGGNRFLGMVYGTTARHSYTDFSPAPVWALWESFGIKDARMLGYWSGEVPVSTSVPEVKATCYVKDGATLISLGNFSDNTRQVRLSFDWQRLGLDPAKVRLVSPQVDDFQPQRSYGLDESIDVEARKGLLLIISE